MRRQRIRPLALLLALLLAASGCMPSETEVMLPEERLTVTYQTMPYSRLEDLEQVREGINAIARAEIGREIELLTIDAQESFTAYPLWLSQGRRVDLMVLNFHNIQSYIQNGQLLPLDRLLEEYGGGIKNLIKTVDLASGATVDGSVYGLAIPVDTMGSGGGLWVPVRYLEDIGFDYDEERVYSAKELDELLARLKEKYPDKYPLGQLTSDVSFSTYSYFRGVENPFGVGGASGSLDMETGRVINFYAAEEYHSFLQQIRRWYELGYIYPDAAYTGLSNVELLQGGEILAIPSISHPGFFAEEQLGEPVVCLRLSRIHTTGGSPQGVFWVIPATCQDPEGAMRFLELMYTDKRIVNLFMWGKEGEHYRFLDETEGVITYPEGITQENALYFNPLGLYGDMRLAYALNDNTLKKRQERYTAQAAPIGPEYAGFLFDEAPVATEIRQVQEVLARYLPVLESGCVELEENYAAFLSALDAAGIRTVIAEKQRQLDLWMAGQT